MPLLSSRVMAASMGVFLWASSALAVVIEVEVRLRGLDRPLVIIADEPGRMDQILLDGFEFKIDNRDRDGTLHGSREIEVGDQKKIEMISLFGDRTLLDIFKQSPQRGGMMLGFINAKEVTCPAASNFVLMYRQHTSRPQSIGNCVTLSQWPTP